MPEAAIVDAEVNKLKFPQIHFPEAVIAVKEIC
jgi:hypothetical protein